MKLREAIEEARKSTGIIAREKIYNETSKGVDVIMLLDYGTMRLLNADLSEKSRTLFAPTADDLMADDWFVASNHEEWVTLMSIEEATQKALEKDCCMIRLEKFKEVGAKLSVIKPTNSSAGCVMKYKRNGKISDCTSWSPNAFDLMACDWILISGPEERLGPFQQEELQERAESVGDSLDVFLEAAVAE